MKFVILSVVCLIGAVVAAPASPKRKRDILPGDSRYGTDYNHHHEAANEIQSSYGPPNYSPAPSIIYQESVQQPSNQYVPAVDYQQEHHSASQNNAYLAPAASAPQPSNQYLEPAVQAAASSHDSYGAPVVQHEAPVHHVIHHVQIQASQPAPVHYQAAPSHQHVQAVHHHANNGFQSAASHYAQVQYTAPQPQTYHVQIARAQPVHNQQESAASQQSSQLVGSNGGYVY